MDGTISFSAFSAATMDFLRFVMDHSGSRRRKRIRENKDTGVAVSYFCYYYRHFHGNVTQNEKREYEKRPSSGKLFLALFYFGNLCERDDNEWFLGGIIMEKY